MVRAVIRLHAPTRRRLSAALVAVWLLTSPSRMQAQRPNYARFDPLVISVDRRDPVLFETAIGGTGVQATLTLNAGGTVTLSDNGTQGDRIAGDGVYSALISPGSIVPLLAANDVNRVFVGLLNVNGVNSGNVFADVITPDVPRLPVTRLASDIQSNDYLVNILDPGYFVSPDSRRITQYFYRYFADDYDFINIISEISYFQNRSHFRTKNTVSGIGLPQSDESAGHGSAGRLVGYSIFPSASFFDGANSGYVHEIGHQWINHLNAAPLDAGIPHWPISSMATGVMGWSLPGIAGGLFQCEVVQTGLNIELRPRTTAGGFVDLDLYLMGLLPHEEVGPNVVLTGLSRLPVCNGQTYTGPTAPVSINDIRTRFGPREPAFPAAQNRFHIATIVVSRDGLLDADAMSLYAQFSRRAEETREIAVHEGLVKGLGKPFAVATGGRATLDARLRTSSAVADFDVSVTPNTIAVARGSVATTTVRVQSTAGVFGDRVTLTCTDLPPGSTCNFAPTDLVPGATGVTATLTITASATLAASSLPAISLAAALITVTIVRVRRGGGTMRVVLTLGVVAIVLAALTQSACGPIPDPPPSSSTTSTTGTPPGSYTVTINAASGALRHSTTLTVRVQ